MAAAPAPEAMPQPGVPTMNLLETDTRALTASGAHQDRALPAGVETKDE